LAFYEGNIFLQSINGSYISLIPKINGATRESDFSPHFSSQYFNEIDHQITGQSVAGSNLEYHPQEPVWLYSINHPRFCGLGI